MTLAHAAAPCRSPGGRFSHGGRTCGPWSPQSPRRWGVWPPHQALHHIRAAPPQNSMPSFSYAACPVCVPWGHWSSPALALSPSLRLGAPWGAQKPQAPWGSGDMCLPAEPFCGIQLQGDSPAPEGRTGVLGTGTCGGSAPTGSSSSIALGTLRSPGTGGGTSQHGAAGAQLMQPLSSTTRTWAAKT